jgi:hypothetical protein
LNLPIKRHRVTAKVKKQDPTTCILQETHFTSKDTEREIEGIGKILHVNGIQKE